MQTKEEYAIKAKEYRRLHPEKVVKWEKTKRIRHAVSIKKRSKLYRESHKDKIKDWDLKNKYGITLEQYNELLLKQNNTCVICGKHQLELNRSLCVDHNHEKGEIRGLLCTSCNLILGYANDNIVILEKAIKYLENA